MIHHAQKAKNVGARFIAPIFPPSFIPSDTPPSTPTFILDSHHRRSIRLRGYDYSQAGGYFVTLCTHNKECLFGAVVGDVMQLNDAGRLVQDVWDSLPKHYSFVELDYFVVMPNHIHGIVVLNDVGARFIAPNSGLGKENQGWINQSAMNCAPKLGEIIRAFKARCTHGINQLRAVQCVSIWQRNYYEHVIRNEASLQEIREYISNNPAQWAMDRENPDVVVNLGAMNRAPTGIKA
jgi:putative transposase